MPKTTVIKYFVIIFLFIGILCTGAYIIGYRVGAGYIQQLADQRDRDRLAEYGRQMGLVTSTIRELDKGLGDIQSDLTSIGVAAARDAKDLRELAQRLRTIASDVKAMEEDIVVLRDRGRSMLSSIGGDFDVGVSDEVVEE